MSRRTKKIISTTIRVVIMAFFFLLVVLPIYWMVITSFKTSTEVLDLQNISYFPRNATLENYSGLFSQYDYHTWTRSNFHLLSLLSTPFKNVIFRRNRMSFFAGQHTGVYSLNYRPTCRLEARQVLIYQCILDLTGENDKYNYSKAARF